MVLLGRVVAKLLGVEINRATLLWAQEAPMRYFASDLVDSISWCAIANTINQPIFLIAVCVRTYHEGAAHPQNTLSAGDVCWACSQ